MESGIVCLNLVKKVGRKVILNGLNLKASKGEIIALLGPNGAGKTTSFAILCGLTKPDSGSIFLNGEDITDLPMYKRARLGLGYLPQEESIFRGLNVEDNINAVLEMDQSTSLKERKDFLNKLLEDLALKKVCKSPAVSISGGERRKLEIARALAARPSFILLDEPFAGIDPLAIAEMRDMIFTLKRRGIGVIITDHNVRDTLPIADYGYVLYGGKVLVEGTPDSIIKDNKACEIYLGESFMTYNTFYGKEE